MDISLTFFFNILLYYKYKLYYNKVINVPQPVGRRGYLPKFIIYIIEDYFVNTQFKVALIYFLICISYIFLYYFFNLLKKLINLKPLYKKYYILQ